MITYLEQGDQGALLTAHGADPVLEARIHTAVQVYGLVSSIVDVWLAQSQGSTAVIMRFDGVVTILGEPDPGETAAFLQFVGGFREVNGSESFCQRLSMLLQGAVEGSYTMTYCDKPPDETQENICENPVLRDVYDLVKMEGMGARWDAWYPHVSHVLRHDLGFHAAIYQNAMMVATGGVYATSAHCGAIGAVITLPEYRGRGYAAAIVRYLSRKCVKAGLTPALHCAQDSLAEYYSSLGFLIHGRWGRILFA